MSAHSKLVILATLVALVSAIAAGAANAEPKNQWPFIRPAGARALDQTARLSVALGVAPTPEAKNEMPFIRRIGARGTSAAGQGSGVAFAAAGGDSGGVDWTLVGWGLIAAVTVAGGTAVALSSMRLPPRSRA
jgi:hypothetical protein